MRRRRTLITSPLEWQLTAAPVSHPLILVLAERGGIQLKTPRPVLLEFPLKLLKVTFLYQIFT